jgi:hypothetical protein
MSDEAESELQRLRAISARTPVWLKCLFTGIASLFALLTLPLCIMYGFRLLEGLDGSVKKLVGSLLGLAISLLLLAVSRDLWMLPKIIEGKGKTWVM